MEFVALVGHMPETTFWVNASFAHDVLNQLHVFTAGVAAHPELSEGKSHRIVIYANHEEGHYPPGRPETCTRINEALDGLLPREPGGEDPLVDRAREHLPFPVSGDAAR